MEDQANEWKNQGYEENNGCWIWDKGLALGKKILVTGFVISSAPFLLPPLVVISALGLACSVPYGIYLASHACTEKLTSKLLPTPATFEEKYGGEDAGLEDDFGIENEEEELKRRVEMRLEQDEKGAEEEKSPEEISEDIGEKEEEEPVIEKSKDEEAEICGITIEIEGEKTDSNVREEEQQLEVTGITIEVCQGGDKEENEELLKETTGLMEKLRDEGMIDEGAGKEKRSAENVHEDAEEGLKENDKSAGKTVAQSRDTNVDQNAVDIDREVEQEKQSAEKVHEVAVEGLKKDDTSAGETVAQSGGTNVDQNAGDIDREVEQNGHKTNGFVENASAPQKTNGSVEITPALQKEKVSDKKAGDENIRGEDKSVAREEATPPGGRGQDNREKATDHGTSQGNNQSSNTPPNNADSLQVTAGGIPSGNGTSNEPFSSSCTSA
ncbi:cilia- and flagella-associated protein 251 isoform X2 [Ricinus communis]|uniref:cilia- and flagella-associated protein 251 isoform X2 n=1 Tax=Ricinus communis TaxID=3988 RepID=UPI000772C751|nr:cilia- and flagella-associated protein 251 isoform X2 [Ricinus communis]|eukprot:XP_015570533.1 cilia- and flagella-associated protein 251 isoform X2 [Ricinus communis]